VRHERVERRASKSVRGKRETIDDHGLGLRPVTMSPVRMRRPKPASDPQLFHGSMSDTAGPVENVESNERKLARHAVMHIHHEGIARTARFRTGDVHAEEEEEVPSAIVC
jgi:hypothetical protein